MPELRRTERIKSFLRAQILFNNRMTTIDCLVKNISAEGAKVEVSQAVSIPTEFEIYIPQKNRTHNAHMVWRDANAIGIEFMAADAQGSADEPQPDVQGLRVRALEMQNAELRVRIRELSKRLEDLGQDPELSIRQAI
jgi:hypothetical protein